MRTSFVNVIPSTFVSPMLRSSLVIAMMLTAPMLLIPSTASADFLFTFAQTSSTPAGALLASGSLLLDDVAFQSGISVNRFQPSGGPANLASTGIDLLDLSVTGPGGVSLAATTADFIAGEPVFGSLWS